MAVLLVWTKALRARTTVMTTMLLAREVAPEPHPPSEHLDGSTNGGGDDNDLNGNGECDQEEEDDTEDADNDGGDSSDEDYTALASVQMTPTLTRKTTLTRKISPRR
ncbi:hypothetical protein C0991_010426 [Blastosporella zonata]|nr:hypothetical protein C0991_010426 [Blastosporella zonata]